MPAKTKYRVIIDTNLWVSFLLTNDQRKIDELLSKQLLTILFSEELLDEFIAVAQRPKFRRYFSLTVFESLLLQLRTEAEFVKSNSVVRLCRDTKDDFLLALAADGNATHLITGDKDLLVLKRYKKTKIMTMADFISAF